MMMKHTLMEESHDTNVVSPQNIPKVVSNTNIHTDIHTTDKIKIKLMVCKRGIH